MKIKNIKNKYYWLGAILIILIYFLLSILSSFRFMPSPLRENLATKKLVKDFNNGRICHETCWQRRHEWLNIVIADDDRIKQLIVNSKYNVDLQIFLVKNLINQDLLLEIINNKNIDHMLKLEAYKLLPLTLSSAQAPLLEIVNDKSLSITQRKVALRSLYSIFPNDYLAEAYKDILKQETEPEILKEAIKGLSNISEKSRYFFVSDLDIFSRLLNFNNVSLEQSLLFLLNSYSSLYPSAVRKWLGMYSFNNQNQVLVNSLLHD